MYLLRCTHGRYSNLPNPYGTQICPINPRNMLLLAIFFDDADKTTPSEVQTSLAQIKKKTPTIMVSPAQTNEEPPADAKAEAVHGDGGGAIEISNEVDWNVEVFGTPLPVPPAEDGEVFGTP